MASVHKHPPECDLTPATLLPIATFLDPRAHEKLSLRALAGSASVDEAASYDIGALSEQVEAMSHKTEAEMATLYIF